MGENDEQSNPEQSGCALRDALESRWASVDVGRFVDDCPEVCGNNGNCSVAVTSVPGERGFVIENGHLLTADRPPAGLRHRDSELQTLERAFGPLARGETARGAFIYGPSGVGKTASTHYLLDKLERVADVTPVYVDAWDLRTRAAVLREILSNVREIDVDHWRGDGTDTLVRELRDLDGPVVVVLDEADRLDQPSVCRDLIAAGTVSPVVVANSYDGFLARLDERVRSRLSRLRAVRFDRYSVGELVAILQDRVGVAVRPDAVGRGDLERVADHAAGDARYALNILYEALEFATERGDEELSAAVIDDAVPGARQSIVADVLSSLREPQHQLVEAIAEVGPAQMGEVYEEYEDRVADPPTRRTVTNWAAKLEAYDVVAFQGSANAREYDVTEAVRGVL